MSFLKITTAVTLGMAMSIGTALAAYPEKPVKIIVGFSAGGGTDTTAPDLLHTCTKHQA